MYQIEEDTIAAISTPIGEGGIGIVRLSGSLAEPICRNIFRSKRAEVPFISHVFQYGEIIDPEDGTTIDEALVVVMKSPKSYTREDVVEIQSHGGYVILRRILELLLRKGARLAQAGEFTRRAFLNGRIDLTQAEAVLDVINARTSVGLEIANRQLRGALFREIGYLRERLVEWLSLIEALIDFPEEEIDSFSKTDLEGELGGTIEKIGKWLESYDEGRTYREGIGCAIIGKTNVGKSSLLNVFVNEERAIVTPIAGTTRDVIEEIVNIRGIPVRLMDTAGLRLPVDPVEAEGVKRTRERVEECDLVLAVLDGSRRFDSDDRQMFEAVATKKRIIVLNKRDLPEVIAVEEVRNYFPLDPIVAVSLIKQEGIDALKEAIFDSVTRGHQEERRREPVILTNLRHKTALEGTKRSLMAASRGLHEGISLEFIAFEIRCGLEALGEIIGETTTEEILDRIFQQFCIGK